MSVRSNREPSLLNEVIELEPVEDEFYSHQASVRCFARKETNHLARNSATQIEFAVDVDRATGSTFTDSLNCRIYPQRARMSVRISQTDGSFIDQERDVMDAIRSLFVVGLAQLAVLGGLPAIADADDDEGEMRRLHSRRCSHSVSHCRADYPVISNWLTSPDNEDSPCDIK